MKFAIRLLTLIALLLLIWYLLADRATPFTGNARVKMVVTPIVPQVSGQVIELSAQNGRIVTAGDSLARIDPTPFEIARDTAQADLATVLQELGAGSAGVEGAQASLARAQADLNNVQLQTARVFEMERKGLVATARGDDARAALAAAQSALEAAQADLDRARNQLGPEDEENPAVRRALAALAQAELELSWTELVAPATGGISNLDIAPGAYATAGRPLMRFLDSENVWIEAYMTENNLGKMRPGARAEVVLDMHPGRVLTGVVESFYGAVSIGGPASDGLSSPPRSSGWMREPQRFPVRILLPGYVHGDAEDDVFFQLNGQADIVVYTGENTVLNMLGSWYIRAMSWLSYAY
ncbi:efflux RND transporter periplasmic adaptor subunit [Tropicimonas sp. TH_r6]|uniref:HlyD family secretion protein n=1 Tax=Tropicimonas sp. TH_r6 TaxID=3082085 RepID=UPI0029537652|nr:efflux RND transporter periplasmic adaptor subunit [Tropicimonas sp. TH_r6]MDV7145382.1 efflux RND transporter periplasmic adaptor subunit [Tropicimonas sp. TH_r6]